MSKRKEQNSILAFFGPASKKCKQDENGNSWMDVECQTSISTTAASPAVRAKDTSNHSTSTTAASPLPRAKYTNSHSTSTTAASPAVRAKNTSSHSTSTTAASPVARAEDNSSHSTPTSAAVIYTKTHPQDPCNNVTLAMNFINDGPFQPISIFPVTKGRKFRPEWYKLYPWLEYSTSEDKAYCFICRVFYHGTNNRSDEAFTVKGFNSWKKAIHSFDSHNACKSHINNNVKFISFQQSQQSGSVKEKIDYQYSINVQENKSYLTAVCETIMYCARQGIALRGHDEAEDSKNRGNFLELMELRSKESDIIKRMFSNREKNFQYVAPSFQNEFLTIIGNQIKRKITEQVKKSGIFAIIADETQDIAKHEQVAVVLRYVDDNLHIHESFVGFYRTNSTDGEALAELLKSVLIHLDLDLQSLVAQCYDGASSMRGPYKGVASRLIKENPKAMYIHCHAHVLNLCIVSCCTSVQAIRNTFFDLQSLYNFIERSFKRHAVFERIRKGSQTFVGGTLTLKSLSDTRWYCRVEAVRSLIDNFDTTIETLNEIASEDPAMGGEANALLKRMEDFHFLFTLLFLMRVLTQCDTLSKALQSGKINYATVKDLAKSTIDVLNSFRAEEFFLQLWTHCQQVAENCNFSPPTIPRLSRVPQRLGGGSKAPYDSVEQFYKVTVVNPVVDILTSELSSRLDENNLEILNCLSSLLCANEINAVHINKVSKFYDIDNLKLTAELQCFYRIEKVNQDSSFEGRISIITTGQFNEAFPTVFYLFRVLLTIPTSSAACERSFSCLRRLKTYCRNSTGQDRLSALGIVAIEKSVDVDLDKVIEEFSLKDRRLQLK